VSSAPAPATLSPGAVFHGRYRVVRALKTGGLGSVYEVVDQNTAAPRALKVMLASVLDDADQRARFALEARVTGSIESDHLVRVSDSGIDAASGSPFLVMELLRGEDLGDVLARRRNLPPAEVVTYLSQASLALDKTHAANVVHRDLKPDNLIVTRRDDGSPCVKILDFGIAKVVTQDQHKTRPIGTPLYMAPEQIQGEASPRTDLYALAQVAYTLLTGEPYWLEDAKADASLYALLMKLVRGAEEPPTARALRRTGVRLPAAFDAWFFKATAVAPAARFERATAQIAALAELLAEPLPTEAAVPPSIAYAPTLLPPEAPSVSATASWSQALTPTLPGPSGPARATLLSPGAAPPAEPLGPSVPAPPGSAPRAPASRGLIIALVAVGGVLAAGVVLLGVVLLEGGGGGSGSPGATKVGCIPNATCVRADVPDPAHADAQALLPGITKIARGVEGHAALTDIYVSDVGKDGTIDIDGGDRWINYRFNVPAGSINVHLRARTAVVTKGDPQPALKAVPDPQCSMKAAYKAAVAAGVPPGPDRVQVLYAANDLYPGGYWTVAAGARGVLVEPKACAVTTKW
jgi:serine/threonine-protein kinase